MIKRNKYILLFLVFFQANLLLAQQTPHHTHYVFNTQIYNPAYVATKDFANLTLSSRIQWSGIDGAPETHLISGFKNFKSKNFGIGGSFMLDRIGPQNQKSFNLDASYSIKPSNEGRLAFGLKLGGNILEINSGEFNPQDPNDPLATPVESKFKPTLSAGAYYWSTDKWYLGASVTNLLHNKHYVSNVHTDRPHYYLMGGYVYEITRQFKIKPAILTKIVGGAPISINASASVLFNDNFSMGLSYNNGQSVSALISAELGSVFTIGYAFDYPMNSINQFSSQSHEIVLSYRFTKSEKSCDCPTRFF